jgi:OFA family oxalate/formate antiporter-like MFS transporter
MGALLTTFPIAQSIKQASYQQAMFRWGLVFSVIGILAAQGLRRPSAIGPNPASDRGSLRTAPATSCRPSQMLRTPTFWLMFMMMTMMSTAGLMVTSQMAAFTRDFGMAGALQGIGSVLGGPVAAQVHDASGTWMPVLAMIIAMNFATAFLAGVAL